jgi:hypothetical protein
VNVTPAEYAQLQARAQSPVREGWRDGALSVFVPGIPYNFKSGGQTTRGGLMKHRRLVKEWRERTADRIFAVMSENDLGEKRAPFLAWKQSDPKRVTFTVYSRNAFDSDGREVCCSPSRDALKDMHLVTDDRDSAGNVFIYEQITSRKATFVRGIAIRIELRKD